jgi:excinuclease ABC subunit B
MAVEDARSGVSTEALAAHELDDLIRDLEKEMKAAAKSLEFERAAALRDQVRELRETQRLMDRRPEWERLRDDPVAPA